MTRQIDRKLLTQKQINKMKTILVAVLGALLLVLGSCSQEQSIPQESGIESIKEYNVDDYRKIYIIETKSERITVFGHYKHGMVVLDYDSL